MLFFFNQKSSFMFKFSGAVFLFMVVTNHLMAMPCDHSYICSTKSNSFAVEFRRCTNADNLEVSSLQIKGEDFAPANVELKSIDGGVYGLNNITFVIQLPLTNDDKLKKITRSYAATAELSNKFSKKTGLLRYFATFEEQPSENKQLDKGQKITCEISE